LNKENLIARHLEGSLTNEEQATFESRMASDATFATEVEKARKIWALSADAKPQYEVVDVAKAWMAFEQLKNNNKTDIQEQISKSPAPVVHMWNWRTLTRVAAVALIVLASVVIFKESRRDTFLAGVVLTPSQNHETLFSLEDGSDAYLAQNSQLEIEEQYNRERRKTRLSGTAFFVVKPDKDKVFEVVTSHLKTIVKGTTFLIRTNDHSTTVGVQTGVVEVQVGNQTETLHAGEQLIVLTGGMVKRSELNSEAVRALKESTKSFENSTLSSILKQVKLLYNLDITADAPLLNKLFTVDFSHAQEADILDIISTLTQGTLHKKGEIYVLKQ
jgi:ferric-dicitrate binding protein FerR (iron transport regulator)